MKKSRYNQHTHQLAVQNANQLPVQDLETSVQEYLNAVPIAQIVHMGRLEQLIAKHSELHFLLEQIQCDGSVIALDFGWVNYVTFINKRGWGVIPNLNPRKTWLEHEKKLESYLSQVLVEQSQIKFRSQKYKNLELIRDQIEVALGSEQSYRREVRNAMFERLEQLCDGYKVILTETLDVEQLYLNFAKKTIIDDLDWWNLLKNLGAITKQEQQLVLLPQAYKSICCPGCLHSEPQNREGQRFKCKKCGFIDNPDVVALLNIWSQWMGQHQGKNVENNS